LRVSILIEGRFRDLLEANPDVDEVLQIHASRGWDNVLSRLRMVRELRQREFSVCLNLHGGPTSAYLTAASGRALEAGLPPLSYRWAYHLVVPDARGFLGTGKRPCGPTPGRRTLLVRHASNRGPAARLFVRPAHAAWWREWRAHIGIYPEPSLRPVESSPCVAKPNGGRQNASPGSAPICRASWGYFLCTHGGPGESSVLDAVERAAGAAILRLENLSLGQLAAAIQGARLFVGTDSGPAQPWQRRWHARQSSSSVR